MTDLVAYIHTKNLSYSIKKQQILDNVELQVFPNEITFLLGRNGAGKTTLFSLLTGFYKVPSNSLINIFGLKLSKYSHTIFKKLGLVFQQRTLDLDLSVKQNLVYFAQLHALSKVKALAIITETLKNFGLLSVLNHKIRTLSGGQIRRIELVRSLLNKPKLLLLDEPTVGLDVKSRIQLMQQVRKLTTQKLAVLWSTHLMDEIEPDDKVIILEQGKIIAEDYASEIIKATNSDNLQQAFIKLTGVDINE